MVSNIFVFSSESGEDFQFDSYFSNGLKLNHQLVDDLYFWRIKDFYFDPYLGGWSRWTNLFQCSETTHQFGEVFAFFGETFSDSKIQIRRKWKIGGLLISKEISHVRRARMAGWEWWSRICLPPQKTDIWEIEKNPTIWRCIPGRNHGDFPAIVMLVNSEDGCSILEKSERMM